MDEAMHPLTISPSDSTASFLPSQNGAPVRLVVPWSTAFKSIKSIVKIRFVESSADFWNKIRRRSTLLLQRQSRSRSSALTQATERRIGEFYGQDPDVHATASKWRVV